MTTAPVPTRVSTRDVLLPGTPVLARGLAWEVVHAEHAGEQLRYRLRCTQGDLRGREIELLSPFEKVEAVVTALDPKRAGPLQEWLLYHRAFLLEQALGPSALQAVQPGRLDIAPYQIVPVMRALSLSRPRLLLADGVGLGNSSGRITTSMRGSCSGSGLRPVGLLRSCASIFCLVCLGTDLSSRSCRSVPSTASESCAALGEPRPSAASGTASCPGDAWSASSCRTRCKPRRTLGTSPRPPRRTR